MGCRALGCLSFAHTMIFCVQRALHTLYFLELCFSALGLSFSSRFGEGWLGDEGCEECGLGWNEEGMVDCKYGVVSRERERQAELRCISCIFEKPFQPGRWAVLS